MAPGLLTGYCGHRDSSKLPIPTEALVSLFISAFVLLTSLLLSKILSGIASWMRDLTSLNLVKNGAWWEICWSWKFTFWKKSFLVTITVTVLILGIMNPLIWTAVSLKSCLVRGQSKDLSVSGCADPFDFRMIPYGDDSACKTPSGCEVLQMAWERLKHNHTLDGAMRKNREEVELYSTAQVELPSNTSSAFWLGSPASNMSAKWSTEIRAAQEKLNPQFFVNRPLDNKPLTWYCGCCTGTSPMQYRIVPDFWINYWYGLGFLHNFAIMLIRPTTDHRVANDLKVLGYLDVEGNSKASLLWRYSRPADGVLAFGKTSMRKILISNNGTLISNNGTHFYTSGNHSEFASRLLTFYAYISGPLRQSCPHFPDDPKMKLVVTTNWTDHATGETWSAACSPDPVVDRANYSSDGRYQDFGVCFVIRNLGVMQNFSNGSFPQSTTPDPPNKGNGSDTYALLYDPVDSELRVSDVAGYEKLFIDWDQEETFTNRLLQTFTDTCLNLHANYEARVTVAIQRKVYLLPTWLVILFGILSVAYLTSWVASCGIKRWSDYDGSLSLFLVTYGHALWTTESGLEESLIRDRTRQHEGANPQGRQVALQIMGNDDPHNSSPRDGKSPPHNSSPRDGESPPHNSSPRDGESPPHNSSPRDGDGKAPLRVDSGAMTSESAGAIRDIDAPIISSHVTQQQVSHASFDGKPKQLLKALSFPTSRGYSKVAEKEE